VFVEFVEMSSMGDPKIDENCLNPQDMCSKNPGACFFTELAEAPQAAATQMHRHGGGLEIDKKLQNPQDTCAQNPAEALQAAATQTHRAGDP